MKIKVATYNLCFGGGGRESLISQVLTLLNADVVILTEASNSQFVAELAQKFGMNTAMAGGKKTSIALLSRLPILEWASFDLRGRPLLEAKLGVSDEVSLMLYGLHLKAHYFKWNEQQRVFELSSYLNRIRSKGTFPHLLLGDFNAIAPQDNLDKKQLPFKEKMMLWWEKGRIYHDAIGLLLSQGYTDCFRKLKPDQSGFTLPSHAPHVRLDYVFASSALVKHLTDCNVLTPPDELRGASDHLPFWVTFDL